MKEDKARLEEKLPFRNFISCSLKYQAIIVVVIVVVNVIPASVTLAIIRGISSAKINVDDQEDEANSDIGEGPSESSYAGHIVEGVVAQLVAEHPCSPATTRHLVKYRLKRLHGG